MILTDLGQMRDRAKQLLRQSRGSNELHAEEDFVTQFFAGFGSLRNSSLASADTVCRAAGSLSISWYLPCVSICSGAGEDDKRIPVG